MPDLGDPVAALVQARRGHFRLESGHHGDLWLDLDGLFWSAAAVVPLAEQLADRLPPVDVVCGPLVGGALLGQIVAAHRDVPFVHAERTTTGEGLYSADYRVPLASRLAGSRVGIVDDVVNAGSAVRATARALVAAGAAPVAVGALLVLGGTGREWATDAGLSITTLAAWPNTLWEPSDCPLCAVGDPLESVG